ncbi:MAG: purine-nucleoside phosphorylase [Candidatus Marinimicrobia bacterium]|nr:purine-nucleoside phosphorylase [Candidatus Neomarinimicrobiota bacterium]MDD5582684.1 purine-nucleoside phosphorylase [Candidatus Neomarinimicrobiota bacterium]
MRDPLKDLLNKKPVQVAIVLGSGLGEMVSEIIPEVILPYKDIPGFPTSTVEGHEGKFVLGEWKGHRLLAAKGRFHYYEGYSIEKVLSIIEYFHDVGITHVVITNAAGLINTKYPKGTIFRIDDFIDFTKKAAEAGDLTLAKIRDHEKKAIDKAAKISGVNIGSGIYVWTTGPSYETPAEIQYFSRLGADIVGMSTMPEVIRARSYGMNVYPLSCATNYAAGIKKEALYHEEVTETALKVSGNMKALVSSLLTVINQK